MCLGLSVLLISGGTGCVGSKQQSGTAASAPIGDAVVPLDPGAIGVVVADGPAIWSFDAPRGQIDGAKDSATENARAALELPAHSGPEVGIITSAAGAVAAPVAAAIGAIRASHSRLSEEEVDGCKKVLAKAFCTMSQQNHLRDRILDAAKLSGQRQFVAVPASAARPSQRENPGFSLDPRVGTILEPRVVEIRLQRKGRGDSSFALWIKARARMLRASTGEVIRDETFEYQTGQDLFRDWAGKDGQPFQRCTDTGYRRLADDILKRVFEVIGEAPIVVGEGAVKPVAQYQRRVTGFGGAAAAAPHASSVRLVSQPFSAPGTIYVYSASPEAFISIQRPTTKDEAQSETLSEVNDSFDGFVNHPNVFVALPAMAIAIPVSLYRQTVAGLSGVSSDKYHEADAQVTAVEQRSRPAFEVAQTIAHSLGQRCPQAIVFLDRSHDDGEKLEMVWASREKLLPVSWRSGAVVSPRVEDRVIQLKLSSVALKGDGRHNPSLAVHVEAQLTVLRADDGREIYSCPLRYRGQTHKFTTWAAQDARILKQELRHCYRKVSDTAIEQLIARGIIAPGEPPMGVFADKVERLQPRNGG
jgi:hypothetical protein